ncbi:GntR family transcriptional regulator [Roseovarius atlanticus]|uniref:GntR family transcriptional regulator n=1 Tax=Roseovarius atlanticus TaxID=1641875 RepID=UPI00070D3CE8|nr:GntR family transcriptional regulator [Roseovarius atlanticus]
MQQDAKQLISDAARKHLEDPSCKKRSAVRLAIIEAIRSGVAQPGDPLPTERELVDLCGVSLGTVQAALQQLTQMDLIERKRGSGTSVKNNRSIGDQVWHFRFQSVSTQESLKVLAANVQIQETSDQGEWSEFLGRSDTYLRIDRELQLSEGLSSYARMYLHPKTAPGLLERTSGSLTVVNIRAFLKEEFGVNTTSVKHDVLVVDASAIPFDVAAEFKAVGWYEITARTQSPDAMPVYFQKVYAPVTACKLTFGKLIG